MERGTHLADSTAKSLTTVVEGAAQITATINHISDASTEQSDSISQVAVGIDQISSVVQTNSATAEESAATSEELSSQAQLLKELVARHVPLILPRRSLPMIPQAFPWTTTAESTNPDSNKPQEAGQTACLLGFV